MCPRSSDPFYIVALLYKIGHYFLYIQYYHYKTINKKTFCDLSFFEAKFNHTNDFKFNYSVIFMNVKKIAAIENVILDTLSLNSTNALVVK